MDDASTDTPAKPPTPLQAAVDYLGAVRAGPARYAFYSDASGHTVVTAAADDLRALGEALLRGEPADVASATWTAAVLVHVVDAECAERLGFE